MPSAESLSAIHAAIPHREPFLLIDEIIEQDAEHIVCRKTFTGEEFWYQGHYPEFPITPGVLLCEAGMQAGAILLSRHTQEASGVPVATRLNDVRFKKPVMPGDTIEIAVNLTERLADAFFLSAKITVNGKLATRYTFACTITSLDA